MGPKADSSSTESPPKKPPTNSAESRKSSSKRTTFHSSSHTTDDPSDTQTQTAKAATPSVESVPSSLENDTQVPSILSTSKTPPDTFSPLEPATSSCSEKATKLSSAFHETRVFEKPSPKNEMPEFNND